MDALQGSFVGGWIDTEEESDIAFFSPPAKSAGNNVTVVVKEEPKHVPSWTSDLYKHFTKLEVLPFLSSKSLPSKQVTREVMRDSSIPVEWTTGLPDKRPLRVGSGIKTYTPFKR